MGFGVWGALFFESHRDAGDLGKKRNPKGQEEPSCAFVLAKVTSDVGPAGIKTRRIAIALPRSLLLLQRRHCSAKLFVGFSLCRRVPFLNLSSWIPCFLGLRSVNPQSMKASQGKSGQAAPRRSMAVAQQRGAGTGGRHNCNNLLRGSGFRV